MKDTQAKPKWVLSLRDISRHRSLGEYELPGDDGETRRVFLRKRKRQFIDTVLNGPLYCASTVRLGDIVFRLKEDDEVYCTTETTDEGRKYYAAPKGMRFVGEKGAHSE